MEREEIIRRCIEFIVAVGIPVDEKPVIGSTFLPGITVTEGKLVVDREKLKFPGDLLHEAGHIAVTIQEERKKLDGDVTIGQEEKKGDEMAVLLWSYLAAKSAKISPEIVFHEDGYKGESAWLLNNFENKSYIGLPLLTWMGITRLDADGVPEIVSWLRP